MKGLRSLTRQDSGGSDSSVNSEKSQKRRRENSEKSTGKSPKRNKNTNQQKRGIPKVISPKKMTPPTENSLSINANQQEQFAYLLSQMGKIDTIVTNTNETNATLENLVSEINVIKEKQEVTDKTLRKMAKQINALQDDVENLKANNNKLQQNSLSRDFVIFNLPVIDKKEMPQLVKSLATDSEINFNLSDLQYIFPVPLRNNKKQCIVHGKFHSEKLKTAFLNACREKAMLVENFVKLKANDPVRGTEIYVRSQLTASNRLLAAEARKQKSQGKLLYAWERDGRILVRKTEKSPVIELHSMLQLMSLISPNLRPNNNNPSSEEENEDMEV